MTITSPRLELRLVRDEDLPGVIDAALSGIHDPSVMPFSFPWTDVPRDDLIRNTARHHWHLRSEIRPDNWALSFVIRLDGTPIGIQAVNAHDFSVRKTVGTGSWIAQRFQGQGFGKECRAAILLFVFDHLDAEVAESSAAVWNSASLGVSRSLGYTTGGIKRVVTRPGELTEQQELRITPADFLRPNWNIAVAGLDVSRRDLISWGDSGR